MKTRPLDIFICTLALFAVALAARAVYFRRNGGSPFVSINANGEEYIYPLSDARVITVNGVIGESVIQIAENSARFVSSPCDNHTCEAATELRKAGDWSACLPNRVFIKIESESTAYDAITN